MNFDSGVAGTVALSGSPLFVSRDSSCANRYLLESKENEKWYSKDVFSVLCTSIIDEERQVIGVLELAKRTKESAYV